MLLMIGFPLAALEAPSVLERSHLFGDPRFLEMQVDMNINTSSGEKSRQVEIRISNSGDMYQVHMQITSPSFLRKMKYLQHKPRSGTPSQWVATSRGTKKITSSGNDERIFDSDFTAADFASLSSDSYRIEAFSSAERDSVTCYRLELSPVDEEEWTKKVLYVDQQSFLIREVEYFRDQDLVKRYRVISTSRIEEKLFPVESIMEDYRNGTSTQLEISDIRMPDSIPDRIFHYRNL